MASHPETHIITHSNTHTRTRRAERWHRSLSEANIGTVPSLFNTCLFRLIPSVRAINTVAHARTHIHNHTHPLAGACRANERHPAAQAVTVVEEDNVNINWPVIAVEYWEDTHNGKVVSSRDGQRFLKHNCGPLTNSNNCLIFLCRTFVPIDRIAFFFNCPRLLDMSQHVCHT